MQIAIPYHQSHINLKIPDEIHVDALFPNDVETDDQPESIIQQLENPVNSVSLREFFKTADEVLFLINDATRPTPTARLLEMVIRLIKNKKAIFMVATGIHRLPSEMELRSILGRFYDRFKDKLYIHDARKEKDMVEVGISPSGNDIWINKHVAQAGKIVAINSVEPHYFAGYTGGRKSFFPGVASFNTVEQNHKFALNEKAHPLNLDGNPVHEDMVGSLGILEDKEIFSIQSVLDRHHKIFSVIAGDIHDSFSLATKKADEVFSVKVQTRADIVIVVVTHPKDINLYQAQNAIENGKRVLKDKGILILVSSCREGIGPSAFIELLSGCPNPKDVKGLIEDNYRLGYHKAAKFAETAEKAEMWGVTGLPDTILEKIFMRAISCLQKAVDQAIDIKGKQAHMVILMDGDKIVPVLEN